MTKRFGLLTAGSDCPGLNAAIRAIGKTALTLGHELVAFQDGFQGLVEDRIVPVENSTFSGILTSGGTILGTSRDQPHAMQVGRTVVDQTEQAIATYERHALDGLICIGGRETQESALLLKDKGLKVITLPKAVDMDVPETEQAIGFDTALEVAVESIDRLHSTAYSNHRILVVELMGRYSGWLTLGAGISAGADVILIPELPYNIHKVADAILKREQSNKRFSIVAVSERVTSREELAFTDRLRKVSSRLHSEAERQSVDAQLLKLEGERSDTTFHVSNQLKALTGLETRVTILGYLLRGGAPSGSDRILATQLGTACMNLVDQGLFGVMLALRGLHVEPVPLEQVAGRHNPVPDDHPWLVGARQVGIFMGE